MIYHPGHFHGISHEADVEWLVNLPICTQEFVGDGKTTRFRLKYEGRKWASFEGAGIDMSTMDADVVAVVSELLNKRAMLRTIEFDNNDSRYVVITPAPAEGEAFKFSYHH